MLKSTEWDRLQLRLLSVVYFLHSAPKIYYRNGVVVRDRHIFHAFIEYKHNINQETCEFDCKLDTSLLNDIELIIIYLHNT